MTAASQPYAFDEFDDSAPVETAPVYSAADLEAARNEARTEALAGALASEAATQTELFATIADRLDEAAKEIDNVVIAHIATLTDAARDIVEQMCTNALQAAQTETALSLIEHYLVHEREEKVATIVISDDLPKEARNIIQDSIAARGRSGTLAVERRPGLAASDIRVEWQGGGLSHSPDDISKQIAALFNGVKTAATRRSSDKKGATS